MLRYTYIVFCTLKYIYIDTVYGSFVAFSHTGNIYFVLDCQSLCFSSRECGSRLFVSDFYLGIIMNLKARVMAGNGSYYSVLPLLDQKPYPGQQNKKVKGKAVPLQAWTGPEGSTKLWLPDFVTTAQDGGKVVSLTHRPPLLPGNIPGTHFCLRLSRPQGHSAIGRILSQ
jgi:hypothetical protein